MSDFTIAPPNGGTWTIQSANTAKVGRYHDLGSFMEGASGSGNVFSKARSGILAGPPGASGTQSPGAFAVSPTTGLSWQAQPGSLLMERSSLVGPYRVDMTSVATGSVGTADPSQVRVDRLDIQNFDGALGDNGGTSLTRIHVTPGTPGTGVPAQPAGTVQLGWWTIPANTVTLTSGMWTPARKSAALRGATRFMLEGDSLSDPGFMSGELRDTSLFSVAAGGGTIDRWNAASATWETVTVLPSLHEVDYSFSGQTISTNTPTLLGWATNTVSSADITLATGNAIPKSVLTFNRGGLWQVDIMVDCNPPVSNVQASAFRFRAPNDTGTILLGSGANSINHDGSPLRIAAGTAFGVILVQQTGSSQSVSGRFRAALLRG